MSYVGLVMDQLLKSVIGVQVKVGGLKIKTALVLQNVLRVIPHLLLTTHPKFTLLKRVM
jgi:hypothetical protein